MIVFILHEAPSIKCFRSVHSVLNKKTTKRPLLKKKLEKIKTWGMRYSSSFPDSHLWVTNFASVFNFDESGQIPESHFICVKCICSRSIGNNSAERLSGTPNPHTSVQSGIPSGAIYGTTEGRGCGVRSGAWKGLSGGSMRPLLLQQLPPQHHATETLPQAEFNIISLCPEKEQPFLAVT